MALPKLDTPIYELKLPSTDKRIKFRPFLVKEEKILLTAQESEDQKEILNSVKQIIGNCIITEDINVDDMPLFDIEYLFLKLRSKSIGETVKIKYKNNACTNNDGKPCDKPIEVLVNLDKVEVFKDKKHTKKIEITDKIGMMMKYPKFSIVDDIQEGNDNETMFNTIISCIDVIYDDKETYQSEEYSKEELEGFLSSMTQSDFNKIKEFFDTMPTIKHTINIGCKNCEFKQKVELKGLNDFFG